MLFRPSFCCNCGEKIERAEWKLWTSRRFCELCATDFTLQDYGTKGVIILAAVVAVFGIVRSFTGSPQTTLVASKTAERPQNVAVNRSAPINAPAQAAVGQMPAANTVEDRVPRTLAAMPTANAMAKMPIETPEAIYICGAATKKGTPCSRRVKGNVRCWQHAGQAAMLPADQLRIGR